jgi:anti-anti-sigma factor
MSVTLQLNQDCLNVVGQLDRFQLSEKAALRFPKAPAELKLNLDQVDHFDTAGLAWILKLLKFYQSKQVSVEILNPPEQLIALAKISNVLELLPFTKSS